MTFTFEWECRELVSTLHVYRALTEGIISKSFKISLRLFGHVARSARSCLRTLSADGDEGPSGP